MTEPTFNLRPRSCASNMYEINGSAGEDSQVDVVIAGFQTSDPSVTSCTSENADRPHYADLFNGPNFIFQQKG